MHKLHYADSRGGVRRRAAPEFGPAVQPVAAAAAAITAAAAAAAGFVGLVNRRPIRSRRP